MIKLINKLFSKKQPEIKRSNQYGSYLIQFYILSGNGRDRFLAASEKRKDNKYLELIRKKVNERLEEYYFEHLNDYIEKVKEVLDSESRNILNNRDY